MSKRLATLLALSLKRTFCRADMGYKLVLCTLVALTIISILTYDFIYVSYGVVLFVLVYNAEYWRQKAEDYKKQLDECRADNKDTSQ